RAVPVHEEQHPVHARQVEWVSPGVADTGVDVLDEGGAGRGPVALPQLPPVRAVVGVEEQRPVHDRSAARCDGLVAGRGAAAAGAVALDGGGAGAVPVALPYLVAGHTVARLEERRAVDVREVGGVRTAAAGADVLDEGGTGGGGVAPPQLVAGRAIVGREEQR